MATMRGTATENQRRGSHLVKGRFGRPAGHRSGFTLLEVQVAFIILGVALAGLCPLVVMQQRLIKKLDARVPAYATYQRESGSWSVEGTSPWVVYYVVPLSEPLAAGFVEGLRQNPAEQYIAFTPTPWVSPPAAPANSISLLSLDYQTDAHSVSALVDVQP